MNKGGFFCSFIGGEGGLCCSVIGREGGFCCSVIGEYRNLVPKPAPTIVPKPAPTDVLFHIVPNVTPFCFSQRR